MRVARGMVWACIEQLRALDFEPPSIITAFGDALGIMLSALPEQCDKAEWLALVQGQIADVLQVFMAGDASADASSSAGAGADTPTRH